MLGLPVLVSNAIIDLDLKGVTDEDAIQVHARENVDIGGLSPDDNNEVVVTVYYEVTIPEVNKSPIKKTGVLRIALGKFEYEEISTARDNFNSV